MFLEFADACRTPTFGMLALASFASGPQQFVWQSALTHLANGNVAVGSNWTPMGTATVTLTNVPPSHPALRLEWLMKIDGTPIPMSTEGISTPMAGTQSVMLTYPPGAGHGTVVNVGASLNLLTYEARSVVNTGAPSAVTVDFATQPIPVPSAVQQTATGATWTQSAGGVADVRRLVWQAMTPTKRVRWFLVEPNNGQTSTTLSLPASHAAEDPTTNASTQLYGTAVFYDDYDTSSGFTLTPPTGNHRLHWSVAETFNMRFPF